MKTRTIKVSLNEIESTTKRAARGAGYDWGLAEDAGKAACWLASRQLPSVDAFLDVFDYVERNGFACFVPVVDTDKVLSGTETLCPITMGSYLNDVATDIEPDSVISIPHTFRPLILVSFVGLAAEATGKSFRVAWKDSCVDVSTSGSNISNDTHSLNLPIARVVKVSLLEQGEVGSLALGRSGSVEIDLQLWKKLQSLAARTYVAASEKSRNLGAGAGLKDSD